MLEVQAKNILCWVDFHVFQSGLFGNGSGEQHHVKLTVFLGVRPWGTAKALFPGRHRIYYFSFPGLQLLYVGFTKRHPISLVLQFPSQQVVV